MPSVDYQGVNIAKDKDVNANTVYSNEFDLRKRSGFFLSSSITTASTGTTHLEVAGPEKLVWYKVEDSEKDISGNTDYAVDMSECQAAYLRQAVTLVGTGTFTTNVAGKII